MPLRAPRGTSCSCLPAHPLGRLQVCEHHDGAEGHVAHTGLRHMCTPIDGLWLTGAAALPRREKQDMEVHVKACPMM